MSTEVEFEVEGTFLLRDTAYVAARVLEPGADFAVHQGATLAGAPLQPYLDIPRAADAAGNQRYDLFVFTLRDPGDRSRFGVGQRVTLSSAG